MSGPPRLTDAQWARILPHPPELAARAPTAWGFGSIFPTRRGRCCSERTTASIAIVKTGPATAIEGELITYTLDVTDPGNTSFADGMVVVSDARCQAPPVLVAKNGDPSPQTLDPGDRWTYQCQVQTLQGQARVDNVGTVRGTDLGGRVVDASSSAVTTLSPPASGNSPVPPTSSPVSSTGRMPATKT